jgi:undecaprenyl-diphosphatase
METFGPGLAALLGLVEGLTEFLPISSTGHLILVGHFLGFTGEVAVSVDISIQLGSILAVAVYERTKLRGFLASARSDLGSFVTLVRAHREAPPWPVGEGWSVFLRRSARTHHNLWFVVGIGLAFVPAAVTGLLLHDAIERWLFRPRTVALALIVGGFVILAVERRRREAFVTRLEYVGLRTAFWVGIAQCFSLFPGVSRSGATIIGGLLAGMDRRVAAEYSFFLALPTMIAATGYKLVKSRDLFSSDDLLALALGLLVSFLVAWAVIAGFLAYVKRYSLRPFAYYRLLLGALVLYVFR